MCKSPKDLFHANLPAGCQWLCDDEFLHPIQQAGIVNQVCLPVPNMVLLPPPHHNEVNWVLRGGNVWTSTCAQSLHQHLNRANTDNVIEANEPHIKSTDSHILWEAFYLVGSTTALLNQLTLIWPSLWGIFSFVRFTKGFFGSWYGLWGHFRSFSQRRRHHSGLLGGVNKQT